MPALVATNLHAVLRRAPCGCATALSGGARWRATTALQRASCHLPFLAYLVSLTPTTDRNDRCNEVALAIHPDAAWRDWNRHRASPASSTLSGVDENRWLL
jgi:hypothetical protein